MTSLLRDLVFESLQVLSKIEGLLNAFAERVKSNVICMRQVDNKHKQIQEKYTANASVLDVHIVANAKLIGLRECASEQFPIV